MLDKRPFRTTRTLANLRQGRNDWYQVKASAGTGEPAELRIYDEIGFFGITAQDLIKDLADAGPGDLDVHIHCPGGDVFEALAIYNALAQRNGTVRVVVDSLAASAASFIAQAASPGQLIVAKNAFGLGIGNSKDLRELADLLDQQSDNIAGIYAGRSGKPVADWRAAMRAESWYVGQAAVDAALADRVQDGKGESQASWDLSVFPRYPGPGITNAAVDESAWDGNAAMSACSTGSDYAAICAGRKAGPPDERGSYALPHHKHPGAAPNRAGVNNAMSRLPQTQGLTNRQAAESHLKSHQSAMGSGSGADDHMDPEFLAALQEVLAQ